MASPVGGVSGSNLSSLYGSRNVMSGLASGMDTESMIENMVSGTKGKITALGQQKTVLEWKQEAYRSVIDKMVKFSDKYTSYLSNTNLLSASFFNKAVATTTSGVNAGKISASGKSTSEVIMNAVKQLASGGRYETNADLLGAITGTPTIKGESEVDLDANMEVSTITGSMTITVGKQKVELNFGELEVYDDPKAMAEAIEEKLGKQMVLTASGQSLPASALIKVDLDEATGEITFGDKLGVGNDVFISGATGDLAKTLGLEDAATDKPSTLKLDGKDLSKEVPTGAYLAGKELSVTLDGVTKKVKLPAYDPAGKGKAFLLDLQTQLDGAFGKDKIKVDTSLDNGSKATIKLTTAEGSTMSVSSPVGELLGIGENATSYLNMSQKLGDVKGPDGKPLLEGLTPVETDADGNEFFELKINGKVIGKYTKDTALETVITGINSDTEAGVSVSYSKMTNKFVFTSKETGAANGVDISGGLAEKMFGSTSGKDTMGKDAIFTMTVNGEVFNDITRSNNTFDVDGLSVTMKETFDPVKDANGNVTKEGDVSFTTKTDADKIIKAVKEMVDDYNAMMTEIKEQYTTLPAKKADGSKSGKGYLPLTEADKEGMSESAIKAYEEKAKQGLLFADNDLSNLYQKLRSAFSPPGADGGLLRKIGLSADYSMAGGGTNTIKLDEAKLRDALETNPDQVKDIFTKTKEGGAATDGLMQTIKYQLDNYARTSGDPKGILVERAGTPHSSVSLMKNYLQSSMDALDKQVMKWENKLSVQVDQYTRKFSQLEQLIMQMNSQSASLAGLMGGGA